MGWTLLVIYVIAFYRLNHIVEEIDEGVVSPSDFTIFLRNIPKDAKEHEIKEWIE